MSQQERQEFQEQLAPPEEPLAPAGEDFPLMAPPAPPPKSPPPAEVDISESDDESLSEEALKAKYCERVVTLDGFKTRWRHLKSQELQQSRSLEYYFLYLDVVHLVECSFFLSARAAEASLRDWSVNRNKITKVAEYVNDCSQSGKDVLVVPPQFRTGRSSKGLRTDAQKRDLHRHVLLMCKVSRPWD